ncbi:hypothetical protein U4E84_15720 [Halorubrum sp. AD140]|uniref:hypothetical protein n=1 Tax=Halorubrum sp. AD140 TaxID=3050073 RepID=UPI002ACC4F1F|nr:hypothetical protein [Halorubrum sp. AD140]MDZ5812793.1 hypothetical protein [Halorubrum sp. AD140]
MTATGTRSDVRAAACAIAVAALFASTVEVAAAAGTTDIGVAAERDTLESGETTTVDVVVADADGGVGALNATVTLSNPDVASVESASIHGDPGLERVTERADGVRLSAALADTDDVGSVTVATVVLRAEGPGQTSVDADVRALGDEDGETYTVGDVDRPAITVHDASDPSSEAPTSAESAADDPASGSTDDETTPGPSEDETASGATDDETTGDSEGREPDDSDDATGGDDQSDSDGSASAGQVVETSGGPTPAVLSPVGVVGAVVIIAAFVVRRLR